MPSSPRALTGGSPPPGAAPAVLDALPWERHPVKEVAATGGDAQELSPHLPWDENSEAKTLEHEEKVNKYQALLAAYLNAKYFSTKAFDKGCEINQNAVLPGDRSHQAATLKASSGLPWDKNLEAKILEHEEKANRYQAMLAARLKAKYFSSKAFDKEGFEEITIQSETIRFSRWPFTSSFADPTKFYREKRCTENMCPLLIAASSAKCNRSSWAGKSSTK